MNEIKTEIDHLKNIGKKSTERLINQLSIQGSLLNANQKTQLTELTDHQNKLLEKKIYRSQLQQLAKFIQKFKLQTKTFHPDTPEVLIGDKSELKKNSEEYNLFLNTAKELIPWKKGPFQLFDQNIDAEWRSDLKWNRIESHLDKVFEKIKGSPKILDIGCNNGYFMYRLLKYNPGIVLGIDPVVPNWSQFQFLHHLYPDKRLFFEMWGVEDIHHFDKVFDLILSMGIVYHHRNPIEQLIEKRRALRPGGYIILETIAIPGEGSYCLFPEDRYAKMRNVWFIPTVECFINWTKKARFKDIELINVSDLTDEEQRLTSWCPPPRESLTDFLDKNDSSKTVEGHPAPIRVALIARRHPDDRT